MTFVDCFGRKKAGNAGTSVAVETRPSTQTARNHHEEQAWAVGCTCRVLKIGSLDRLFDIVLSLPDKLMNGAGGRKQLLCQRRNNQGTLNQEKTSSLARGGYDKDSTDAKQQQRGAKPYLVTAMYIHRLVGSCE